jgi:hypothetical protein
MPRDFDPTITLNDHHLAAAGLTGRKAEAVEAVREAVGRMDGAGWFDVDGSGANWASMRICKGTGVKLRVPVHA